MEAPADFGFSIKSQELYYLIFSVHIFKEVMYIFHFPTANDFI
jgi:hypothetical protein